VLGAVLGAALAGLLCPVGAGASPAASDSQYPPTAPCALSWQPATATDSSAAPGAVLLGSGLGGHQSVRVTLYPQSRTLGAFATDSSGSFAAQVTLPTSSSSSSWLTASSQVSSCSTGATEPTEPLPTSAVGAPGATPSPVTASTGAEAGSGRPIAGPGSAAATSGAARTASPTPAPAGVGSAGTSGTVYPPYPPSTRSPSHSAGSGSSTASGSSSAHPTPSRPSHSTAPQSISSDSLGVPLSIILGIAVLLVVAGGMAVLMLTRRSS
jgi:hypothetical protein